jgi:hypothetical protein
MGTIFERIFKIKSSKFSDKRNISIFLLFVILSTIFCFSVNADDSVSVNIHIIGQPEQFEKDKPKIVAGLWHDISFNDIIDFDTEIILTIYQGETEPSVKNVTNYYQWTYSPTMAENWINTKAYGNETINPSRCSLSDDGLIFCVAIPDYLPKELLYHEIWTLELSSMDETLFKDLFYLEKPTRGFAKSHGDFLSFSVDPFTRMQASANDYFTLKNTGNVPLNISIDYKALDDQLKYAKSSHQIPAFSKQDYQLDLNSLPWRPQRIQQSGTATAVVSSYYLLDQSISGTAISLQTALVIDAPVINIFVGHNSYELTTLDESTSLSFQYRRRVSMHEGETKTINAYMSGEGTAKISIAVEGNISLIQINKNDEPTLSSFTVDSSNAEEQTIGVQLKALSENHDGSIIYTVETDNGKKTFTTQIDVGPPKEKEMPTSIGTTSSVTIFVLLALIVAAGYMLYNHLAHGRSQRR